MDLMAAPRKGKILGDEGALADMFGSVSSSRIYLAVVLLFSLAWYALALWGPIWFIPQPVMPREIDLTFLGALALYFTAGAYGKDSLMAVMPHVGAVLQRLGGARQPAERAENARSGDRSGVEQEP